MGDLDLLREWWTRVAHELRTQDNEITSDPIFVVERRERFIGVDPDYTENLIWVNSASEEEVTEESDRKRFHELEIGCGLEEYSDWCRTGYIDRWVFVQPFLTREAAEAFRKAEAHNLTPETRVFVASGCRNPEWRALRAFFCNEDYLRGDL